MKIHLKPLGRNDSVPLVYAYDLLELADKDKKPRMPNQVAAIRGLSPAVDALMEEEFERMLVGGAKRSELVELSLHELRLFGYETQADFYSAVYDELAHNNPSVKTTARRLKVSAELGRYI